jgi:hypothetical protein
MYFLQKKYLKKYGIDILTQTEDPETISQTENVEISE